MDVTAHYTEIQDDSSVARRGGLTIKGHSRTNRQAVHMILLVDSSGSMEFENKMKNVKQSINMLVSLLQSEDRISLITFSDDSNILLSKKIPTPEERAAIQYRIDTILPDGSTNISAALLDARTLIESADSQRKQGILLLTDGIANVGVMSVNGIVDIVQRIQTESPGVSISTVAYGSEHSSEMLTNIATSGGGAYNVVKNLEDVATVFGDILGGLESVSAQKVEVHFPPNSEIDTRFRTKKMESGETIVYVGDLYAESEMNIMFKHAPDMGQIIVKGINMNNLDTISIDTIPICLSSIENIPLNLLIAEYRNKVSILLARLNSADRTGMKEEVQNLIDSIRAENSLCEHPLRAMLLEDLENAKNILERNSRMTADENAHLAQHSAYLGMTRGLRTNMINAPVAHASHTGYSPFTNISQMRNITAMRALSQQHPVVAEDPSSNA